MSYRALGQAPSVTPGTTLPSPESAGTEKVEHGVRWIEISNDDVLRRIAQIMFDRKATSSVVVPRRQRNDMFGGGGGRIGESEPFLTGLRSLWIRMGRVNEMWPGARGEFNFGPNTDAEQSLRISRDFYNLINSPSAPLWLVQNDGYVRLHHNDALYDAVRQRLVGAGYLDREAPISTKDDSAMSNAIKRWWNEARAQGSDVGSWPDSYNFGPNTNGDEIRIHSKLLASLMSARSPRSVVAAQKATVALAGTEIRGPVIGLPTNLGKRRQVAFSPALLRTAAQVRVPVSPALLATLLKV